MYQDDLPDCVNAPTNQAGSPDFRRTKTPRVRAFSHKVRTGCITWIRRKKCDEEEPTCRRCRESHIKCDGYDPAFPKKRPPPAQHQSVGSQQATLANSKMIKSTIVKPQLYDILPDFMFDTIQGSAADRSYFNHFCTVTIIDFVRVARPEDFWFRTVLPMFQEEPAVRHLFIALGAAHQSYLRKPPDSSTKDTGGSMADLELVALQHYNKAIGELNKLKGIQVSTGWKPQAKILICCLLFICLENMLGRYDEAIRHLQAGCRVLQGSDMAAAPEDIRYLMQEVATLFIRLGVDASTFVRDNVIPDMTSYAMPLKLLDDNLKPFKSFTEAKDAIWDLDVKWFFSGYDEACSSEHEEDPSSSCSMDMSEYIEPFQRWKTKFNLFVATLDASQVLKMPVQRELLIFALRRCMWEIILLPDDEAHEEEAERLNTELIGIAEILYDLEASWLGRPICTLDGDSIPFLYITAILSENPKLMQRIIKLFRQSKRREGTWDSEEAADELQTEFLKLSFQKPAPV